MKTNSIISIIFILLIQPATAEDSSTEAEFIKFRSSNNSNYINVDVYACSECEPLTLKLNKRKKIILNNKKVKSEALLNYDFKGGLIIYSPTSEILNITPYQD
ncbi:hypothetical protein [Spartinivicinus poritis]|uniref:Uncharacterized protein n=1 Tax=Spartinivicinus poritis TaxID=2994640 RepID=A0ABT5U2E5_9GAMM|nr:hypothetical protein [Spartinivicinus sp. A2-2]MDE1460536.1 hypothetical protein [Spartinivicinus sp. A2-2]